MPMFSARNMDVISTEHVVNAEMKNLVLKAKSELHGFASRRSLRHKVQGARLRAWSIEHGAWSTEQGVRSQETESRRKAIKIKFLCSTCCSRSFVYLVLS